MIDHSANLQSLRINGIKVCLNDVNKEQLSEASESPAGSSNERVNIFHLSGLGGKRELVPTIVFWYQGFVDMDSSPRGNGTGWDSLIERNSVPGLGATLVDVSWAQHGENIKSSL